MENSEMISRILDKLDEIENLIRSGHAEQAATASTVASHAALFKFVGGAMIAVIGSTITILYEIIKGR